ncbi:MAG TPA: hypothetical protein VHB20_01465, partial [Verrucomicrobiae bacterium]|nr:hypothetical protein [Verrucomicrobiae bacterium]
MKSNAILLKAGCFHLRSAAGRFLWRVFFPGVWAGLLLCQGRAAALAPRGPPEVESTYIIDAWQTDDGLPQNAVISMDQTTDGYIWLLTRGGLARFDGLRFDVFDGGQSSALAGKKFVHLWADSKGNLWLRDDHGELVMGPNGHFHHVTLTATPPVAGETSSAEGKDGVVWMGDEQGRLLKYEKGRLLVVNQTAPAPDWGPLTQLEIDRSGHPWTWNETKCARWEAGNWRTLLTQKAPDTISLLKPLEDGSVMVSAGSEKRLWRYTTNTFVDEGLAPAGVDFRFITVDPSGEIWFSMPHGGWCRDPQGRWSLLSQIGGHRADALSCPMVDREGNRWFGTEGGGVIRLRRRVAQSFGTAEGMSEELTESLAASGRDGVWVGAHTGGLNYFDGTRFTQAGVGFLGSPTSEVWTLWPDDEGGVWFGTYGRGLFHMDANRTGYQQFDSNTAPGMVSGPIITLFNTHGGDLWIGGQTGGVARYAAGNFHLWTTRDGLADDCVKALTDDSSGAMWVGTPSGLNRIKGHEIKKFTTADGLSGSNIICLFRDTGDGLWIGGRELTRYRNGKFSVIRVGDGLPVTTIQAMIEDDMGCLWLATAHGILRASLEQLNHFCDARKTPPRFSVITKEDGLPSNQCGYNQPSAWKGADGRLWFGTLNGIAVIDPRHLPHNDIP